MSEIKEYINNLARECGFADCKIASANCDMSRDIIYYQQWLKNNYHSDMKYLENHLDIRKNVGLLLDGVNSVIVLPHLYRTDIADLEYYMDNSGRISRYAWGDDYHIILREKCNDLISKLTRDYGGYYRVCIDTAPILERSWALKAGLGWQGKNGIIINTRYGSFFVIAIILSTLEIPSDDTIADKCDNCNLCISSCPTNAIVQPKLIDARRCLSYWTIESNKTKTIPNEIADKMDDYLFGCDICQEVCPWNKTTTAITTDARFMTRFNQKVLDLDYIINLTETEFNERFKNSPLKRIKLSGLQRNALIIKTNMNKS